MATNPFYFGPTSGTSSKTSNPFIFLPQAAARPPLTTAQAIALGYARGKKQHHSILGSLLKGTGSGLGWALDKISRPGYASSGFIHDMLAGKSFEKSLKTGGSEFLHPKHRYTFSEILKEHGVLTKHNFWRAVVGLPLDIVTDPSLPIMIAGAAVAPPIGGAALAARYGATTAGRVAGVKALEKAVAYGAKPLERNRALAEAAKIFDETDDRLGKYAVTALTKADTPHEAPLAGFNLALGQLRRELEKEIPKTMQLRYGFGKLSVPLSPTHIGSKRIAPLTPNLLRAASGSGILGKIPGMSNPELRSGFQPITEVGPKGMADRLGSVFRHGWRAEDIDKPALQTQRLKEMLEDKYLHNMMDRFGPHAKLSKDKKSQVLDLAQKAPEGQIVGTAHRNFNEVGAEAFARQHNLSEEQLDYLRDWHEHAEYLRRESTDFGIKYEETPSLRGRIYVPHVYTREGGKVHLKDLREAGFARERALENSVEEIKRMEEQGARFKGGKIETDPEKLMAIRTRRAANAHATETFKYFIASTHGVRKYVPDVEKMQAWKTKLDEVDKEIDNLNLIKPKNFHMAQLSVEARVAKKVKREMDDYVKRLQDQREVKRAKIDHHRLQRYLKNEQESRTGLKVQNPHSAAIANLQRSMAKVNEQIDNAYEEIAERNIKYRERLQRELQEKAEVQFKKWERLARKRDVVEARTYRQFKKNPDAHPGMVEMDGLIGGEKFLVEKHLKGQIDRMRKVVGDPEELAELQRGMKKLMSMWKVGVTSVNPGYAVRNTLSDVWNMYVDGVPAPMIARYTTKVQKLLKDANKGEKYAVEELIHAHTNGVLSGQFGGDIRLVAQAVRSGKTGKALREDRRYAAAYARFMTEMNTKRENYGRLVHWLYRRQARGMSPYGAAQHVKRAHFDYEELSQAERNIKDKWVPFYTWSRKNIPYQIQSLLTHPGRYATFPKMIREGQQAAGGGDEQSPGTLPKWVANNLGFPVGGKGLTYFLPQFGPSDLAKLEHPQEGLGSLLGPQLKVPYELITGRSMFTGNKIKEPGGHPRNPIWGPAAAVLGAIPGNPANVGQTARTVRGERMTGAGADPWVSYIASQIPWLNQIVNRQANIRRAQRSGGAVPLDWVAYGGGISLYERDLDAEQVAAALKFKEEMQGVMKGLRDEGLLPPAPQKKRSENQKALDRVIARGG